MVQCSSSGGSRDAISERVSVSFSSSKFLTCLGEDHALELVLEPLNRLLFLNLV